MPNHFSFGVMNAPGSAGYLNAMRANNGTAWDFRYQYLAAGVNTAHGWATWNTPAGQIATDYMRESGNNGYLPAFVYYNLLQSNGPAGNGEAGTDLAHLASPTTMNAYYANWSLLMRKIGAYGRPTLVIVEPDLWGFIEQAAKARHSQSAASVPASVASSGYADARGLPNTAQGFAWALLHIRDRYAHNATLALHASAWGTGIDIASNTSTAINAAAIGAETASFLNSAGLTGTPRGISTFDLLSNDIADHDSGQSGIWWDRYNRTFPNFARYLQYAGALAHGTGRHVLLWQVPAGNQYFDTENNSRGHTQDNKAEYILSHVADFAHAGVIGVLFGPGNDGTYVDDARFDGVTNPAAISTFECDRCNTHTSQYADDDGGYLRLVAGQYYRSGGYSLGTTVLASTSTGSSCVPTIRFGAGSATPARANTGDAVALAVTLTASCQASALVDFKLFNIAGSQVWQSHLAAVRLSGRQQALRASVTPANALAPGQYTLKIAASSPDRSMLYGWDNDAASLTVSSAAATPMPLRNAPCTAQISGQSQAGACTGTFTPNT